MWKPKGKEKEKKSEATGFTSSQYCGIEGKAREKEQFPTRV